MLFDVEKSRTQKRYNQLLIEVIKCQTAETPYSHPRNASEHIVWNERSFNEKEKETDAWTPTDAARQESDLNESVQCAKKRKQNQIKQNKKVITPGQWSNNK